MKTDLKLADVFGSAFVEETKAALPMISEALQFHLIRWIVSEVAAFIYRLTPERQDIWSCSRCIVAEELGECCQMIHTVCSGEHERFCISGDSVRPL